MTLEDAYFLSQIIAAVAIVSSLIFVALQLRQTDRTQRAMMHQLRAQRGMDLALRSTDAATVEAMGNIIRIDPQASPAHFIQFSAVMRAMILNLSDVVWQHEAGQLDKETVDNTVAPLRMMFAMPGPRAVWQMSRTTYAPAVASMFDRLVIADAPIAAAADPIAVWRAIAAQLAPSPAL